MTNRRLLPVLEKIGQLPTALVVGGAGFIGSFLCEKLLSLKTQVICLDNLQTGKKENLKNCILNPSFSFIEKDITEPIKNISEKIDFVFHLAGIEEYLDKEELNLKNLLTNSQGTKNLLDLAVNNKANFLLASIVDVYLGYLSTQSLKDKAPNFYSYSEAKRYSEALTIEYCKKFGLNSRIVRIMDVFGPRMNLHSGSEMAEFFDALIFDNELRIPGDGLKTIYPTYVLDLVEGLIRAMFKSETEGKVFNLIGQKTSLINFSLFLKKTNPELKIIYIKGKENLDIPVNEESLIKTAKEIDWRTRNLEESVKETVVYYKKEGKTEPREEETPAIKITEKKEETKIITKTPEETQVPIETKVNREIIRPKVNAEVLEPKKKSFWQKVKFPQFSFKKKSNLFLLSSFLIFLTIFYPPFSALWNSYQGLRKIEAIEEKKIIKDLDNTIIIAQSASKDFTKAFKKIDSLTWLATIIRKRPTQDTYLKILTAAKNSSEAIYHGLLVTKNLNSLLGAMTGEFSDEPLTKINEAKLELNQSQENFSLVLANIKELKNLKVEKISLLGREINLVSYEEKIKEIKESLKEVDELLTGAPTILGKGQRKTYLLLLQNNMELRPTGGFIGSFGLAIFEEGKLIDFKIEDVYTADGQLKGKVKPPDEILHYLGQPSWYLRDSNFSPDFPLSAKRAQWFLEKEMGTLVDGVIGVDLSLAQKLVKAIGGLEVKDYQEKITAENLFEKAEGKAELNFFPGSTQKKNFLSSLGQTLFDKLIHTNPTNYLDLAKAITDSLKERHLMFFFFDDQAQKFFSQQNFSGEIMKDESPVDLNETKDYLMVIDANLGANKANYFLERKIKQEVTITETNEIREKITIHFQNNSPKDVWPAGRYKTYLRIYAPEKATFEGSEISDNKKPKLIKALTEEEIKKLKPDEFLVLEATEAGRKSWGVSFEIPIGKSKEISFSYRLPEELFFQKDGTSKYHLYVQKQAGTVKDEYNLVFNFPNQLKISKEDKLGIEKGQSVYYNTDLLTDREFNIKLKSPSP